MNRQFRLITNAIIMYGFAFTAIFWTLYLTIDSANRQNHKDIQRANILERTDIESKLASNLTIKSSLFLAAIKPLNIENVEPADLRPPADLQHRVGVLPEASVTEGRNIYDLNKFSSERQNIYYVKVHKAGSTTVQNMLYRFGLNRNLLFALFNCHNGMPFPQVAHSKYFFRDRFHKTFNIMCDHALYNESVYSQYMPANTATLGILRHPMEQLRSSIAFHGLAKPMKLTGNDPTAQFLSSPALYDGRAVFTGSSPKCNPIIKSSFTQNGMAYHFGYIKQKNNSAAMISEFIRKMDAKMDLILILERFDESIILLKRMFHWKTQDILNLPLYNTASFFGRNAMKKNRNDVIRMQMELKHRKWSTADYALYEHFYAKLNSTIEKQPQDFFSEVQLYQLIKEKLRNHCVSMCNNNFIQKLRVELSPLKARYILTSQNISISASDWNEAFTVSYINCLSMMMSTLEYQSPLKVKQIVKNCSTGTKVSTENQRPHCDSDAKNYLFYTFEWTFVQKKVFRHKKACMKYFS